MFSLSIQSSKKNIEKILPLLHQHIAWGWEEKDESLIIIHFFRKKPAQDFKKKVQEISPDFYLDIQPVQNTDWTRDWKQFFKPIEINNTFIVLPEWLENTSSPLIKIIITPKMAFGTGHHPTTSLCLKTLSSLFHKGKLNKNWRFLDLGTGSGILGIAGAKLGMSGIGIDIDDSAVDNARENISLNNVQDRFEVRTGEVLGMINDQKFNLIFANIIASTLKRLAAEILSLLHKNQYCLVLSGILEKQVDDVTKVYLRHGMNPPQVFHEEEWSALAWFHDSGEKHE